MRLVDARRLTGPNLLAPRPLVVVEIELGDDSIEACLSAYVSELGRMREALGMSREAAMTVRPHRGGAVFAYAEPIDVMLASAEASEWAANAAAARLAGSAPAELEPKRSEIAALLERDHNDRMLALAEEATRRDLPFLWDDKEVSVGGGAKSITYPIGAIPAVNDVPWARLGKIPIALVTGTNGKTTSTRLLARAALEAGYRVGSTSSDAIAIGGVAIEEGDWTGPQAARTVLRRTDVDLAILETARGGILRRGLAIDECDVALLTNVTDDHLGGYGIDDLDAMARTKFVIGRAVRAGGTIVVNARDVRLVALAEEHRAAGDGTRAIAFFLDAETADDESREVLRAARGRGDAVAFTEGGKVVRARGEAVHVVAEVADVPIAFGGAARYNVENALGVVAAASALGIADDAIARAITRFTSKDNPGRGEIVEVRGVSVLLDFGHNPDGVRGAMDLVTSLRAGREGRLTVITGSAGDRTDDEIGDIARAVASARPDRVLVREMHDYLRGRALGEVPEIFRRELAQLGIAGDRFAVASSEVDALRSSLDAAKEGDFVALLVHLDRSGVRTLLDARV